MSNFFQGHPAIFAGSKVQVCSISKRSGIWSRSSIFSSSGHKGDFRPKVIFAADPRARPRAHGDNSDACFEDVSKTSVMWIYSEDLV